MSNPIDDRSDDIQANNLIAKLLDKNTALRADNARKDAEIARLVGERDQALLDRDEMKESELEEINRNRKLEATLQLHKEALEKARVILKKNNDQHGETASWSHDGKYEGTNRAAWRIEENDGLIATLNALLEPKK